MGKKIKRGVDEMNDQVSQILVSIIIPCYNHGKYLSDAIESCLNQTYQAIEIIVVDDGSSDNTKEVAGRYGEVNYIYQDNQGLSAARNTGIRFSKGEYLGFLDADDMLFEDAIAYNISHMLNEPELAFVSGAHQLSTISNEKIKIIREVVKSDHYLTLLERNYIGMHATVMFRRHVFKEFLFDPTLKACEDYDLYLKVAQKYPVKHHEKVLTSYRTHENNMSNNIPLMLTTVLQVLERHKATLSSNKEVVALEKGQKNFKKYYIKLLSNHLKHSPKPSSALLNFLKPYRIKLYYKIIIKHQMKKINRFLKKLVPSFCKRLLYNVGIYKGFVPAQRNVKFGDLKRLIPFSKNFGYDRGGPIDRYYIEGFLKDSAGSVQGRVLEIGDNEYTLRYGKENVVKSEILHVNDKNPNATIIGDLSDAPQIPDDSFDCIILTQTLHLVYDYKSVIQTCYRILKPGGSLLLTVPGITPIDYGEWGNTWYWSFTGQAMTKILAEYFSKDLTKVNTYGNVYVAAAFLYGIGLPEINKEMLEYHDPQMQVIVTVRAQKEINNET
jgi:glycosyltransferase involved in cell wall biosynthesis